jgi:hypothetical protein
MNKLLLFLGAIFCSTSIFAQNKSTLAIEIYGVVENNRINHNAVNNDYCPYYVVASLREAMGSTNVPGETRSTTIYGLSNN